MPEIEPPDGPTRREPQAFEVRFEQIKAQLHEEWRLKAQGIHHDHLSDLSVLITEVEFLQSQLEQRDAELLVLRQQIGQAELRQGCHCQCCDHGEGSDCACECHADGKCAARLPRETPQELDREVAERIARDLFTNGSNQRAQQLAEEVERTLNREFDDTDQFTEAIEVVLCHFQVISDGLREDRRRAEYDA